MIRERLHFILERDLVEYSRFSNLPFNKSSQSIQIQREYNRIENITRSMLQKSLCSFSLNKTLSFILVIHTLLFIFT